MKVFPLLASFFVVSLNFVCAMEDELEVWDALNGLSQQETHTGSSREGVVGSSVVGPINISGVVNDPDVSWKDLNCQICCDSEKKVIMLPCCREHTICKGCLQSLKNNKCPFCRSALDTVALSQLPERTAEFFGKVVPIMDQVLDQIFHHITESFIAPIRLDESNRRRELQAMSYEDIRSSFITPKEVYKKALLQDLLAARHELNRFKRLRICNICSVLFILYNFLFLTLSGLKFVDGAEACYKECNNHNMNLSRSFNSDFCMFDCSVGVKMIVGCFMPVDLLLYFLCLGMFKGTSDFGVARLKKRLERIQTRYNRELGDDGDYCDGAASSDQPRGGEAV